MQLRLVTLNTWGLPFPIAFHPRRVRFPRIARFLREGGFHVAALQEVWRGAPRLELPGLVLPPDPSADSGLALVSELPVLQVVSRAFRAARGWDAWKKKGVLVARVGDARAGAGGIGDGEGPVTVVSTHLQAGSSAEDAAVRARQADEIVDAIDAVDGPVVVMGDFNLHATSAEDHATVRRLERAGLRDVAADPEAATYVWASHRFDRIYVKDGGGRRWSADAGAVVPAGIRKFLSDHHPVAATLTLSAS